MKNVMMIAGVAGLLFFANACQRQPGTAGERALTSYVDPYIGAGGNGHVFVGANRPFGMVQLGPASVLQTWDQTSGYHFSDTTIIGFSHTHLSGTGIGDLCDISLMPVTEEVNLCRGTPGDPQSGIWSSFERASERVAPGFYSVHLNRYGVDVALTATPRVGFHRYSFPEKAGTTGVVIDLENGTGWDAPVEGFIVQENDSVVSGYRFSTGWANDQRLYFTAVFSQPIRQFLVSDTHSKRNEKELKAQRVYGVVSFDLPETREVFVKVALSPVSISNAKQNLRAELPGWNFEDTAGDARRDWNRELNKIRIETQDSAVKKIFYTAMFHTMMSPSLFCDSNGDYRGADGKVHRGNSFVNYTTFSLWDTYRAAHPLMTIIHPERIADLMNTMIHIYREQGKLPVWHLMGCETNCMVGNPAIPVLSDAILKGFGGFDHRLAFEAMKTSALLDERGLAHLKAYGYIPFDKEEEGLSKCMEYAIADWSLAQAARKLNREEEYAYFLDRSRSYRHYFDPATGFVRGLSSEGKFRLPFNPFESIHRENDYTEGNAWQYTWLVPHDVPGLMELFGGKEAFLAKLDSLFTAEGDLGSQASPDISGLIGQYAHGNEPSHHIAYLYSCAGQPWKTAGRVREIMTQLYSDRPDGLCGNEDAGQMSAWYILSALGFYQVEPAGGKYVFGSPLVDEAVIRTGGGKTFTVKAKNNCPEHLYIQSVRLNGQPYSKPYLLFEEIAKGGLLEFEMGRHPKRP
ncbi:MAG: GH92 family glycosyl hydrolase [Dysgonamonadaceae bacterium]|jgi:predicted alpha-1,2-mannosidase|nr:GH92 family glycosyl hydrolase [Dysgonamonadaceae bacterium]